MIPRLKTKFWVEAFLRQAETRGAFGTILFKGHEDAGQVMILFARPGGLSDVLAPPPGPSIDDDGNRNFEIVFDAPQDWASIKNWLDRKRRLDPDLWAIEVDVREGFCGLEPKKK